MTKIVYVDNNATTPVAPEVVAVMMPYLTEYYYNPSSLYAPAEAVGRAVKEARALIARLLGGLQPTEIIFTSGATESNNSAIRGVMMAAPKERTHIITSSVEHPSVREVCRELARQGHGIEVTYLPVDRSGMIATRDLVRAIRPGQTALVTLMHANNETGVIFPIEKFARIIKESDPQIIVHTDATQTLGKLEIDLKGAFKHVDLLSFSGHKLHTPKGIGVLYMKRGTRCQVYQVGGHQEFGRRAGTENVPYIVGIAKALEMAIEQLPTENQHLLKLRDRLERTLLETIPYLEINGGGAPRLPNTVNCSCHYIEGEGMLYQLNSYGICASSGSACTSGSLDPSHVLQAMHVPFTAIHGSIRFSLGRYNSEADVDHILAVFPLIVASLRKLSPYWDEKTQGPKSDAPRSL